MSSDQSVSQKSANNQAQHTPTPLEQAEKNNYKYKIAFLVVLFFILAVVLLFFIRLKVNNQRDKENVAGLPTPVNSQQVSPSEEQSSCSDRARFSQTLDEQEDETDSATQWKRFTDKDSQVSISYPPHLTRKLNRGFWVYPETSSAMNAEDFMVMELGNYHTAFEAQENLDNVSTLGMNKEVTLNEDLDSEYVVKKIGEKNEGNFSGSIYKTIFDEKNYWHPHYSYVFVSSELIRDKRVVLRYNFVQEEDRADVREDFFKIVNSLEFEDHDAAFIKSLSFLSSFENLSLSETQADGEVYYLRNPEKDIIDPDKELFQLERLNNEILGYVVSRTVCLNDLVGKRMIVSLRKIEGASINNDSVYLIDKVNVI